MSLTIRPASAPDVSDVYSLINELAHYENEPNAVIISENDLLHDGFGPNPSFHLLIAEMDKTVVGMALYYYCYSTWRGRYLYLEDLIVTKAYRRMGIGSQLFEALIQKSKSDGLKQMGWQVLDWNLPAIKFYEKYQAKLDPDWINGRFYF